MTVEGATLTLAIATFVLASFALASAVASFIMAFQTKRSAKATEKLAEQNRALVEANEELVKLSRETLEENRRLAERPRIKELIAKMLDLLLSAVDSLKDEFARTPEKAASPKTIKGQSGAIGLQVDWELYDDLRRLEPALAQAIEEYDEETREFIKSLSALEPEDADSRTAAESDHFTAKLEKIALELLQIRDKYRRDYSLTIAELAEYY
jgi:hypothetical protein